MQKFKRFSFVFLGIGIFIAWLYWKYLRARYIGEINFNFAPLRVLFLSINVFGGILFISSTLIKVEKKDFILSQLPFYTRWILEMKQFLGIMKEVYFITTVQKWIKEALYELFVFTYTIHANSYILNQPYFKLTHSWIAQYTYHRKVKLFFMHLPQSIVAFTFIIDVCILENFYFFPRFVYLLLIPYTMRVISYICENYCELRLNEMYDCLDIIASDIGELVPVPKKDLDKENYDFVCENFLEIKDAYYIITFYIMLLKGMTLEERYFEDIFFRNGLRIFYFLGTSTMLFKILEMLRD